MGFEGLGGWGDAWTLPIDVRTGILIIFDWFLLISEGFDAIQARKFAGLWHRVVGCGRLVLPL